MNRTCKFLLCLAFLFFGTAFANDKQEVNPQIPTEGYKALREVEMRTLVDGRDGPTISLPAGQEFVVIERVEDALYGKLVHIGIDMDAEFNLSDAWVLESDLKNPDLAYYDFSKGVNEGEFEILKKMTYCYRHVKMYLMKIGKVKSYLPGASAYMAAKILPKHGFVKSGNSPSKAKNGEVCVYGGGPQGHGHIEVKRNGKWWYGYGYINHPIRNRRFIACFVK